MSIYIIDINIKSLFQFLFLMDDQDSNNGKGRDFICACGKNYLSYAALFTHIKQKHDGKVKLYTFRHQVQS